MSYRAPRAPGSAELREKGSRFLALLLPVADEREVRDRVRDLEAEHRDATHVCWAWRLGDPPRERWSDAGEPAGTAGVPMLQVLRGAELSDALGVVVRWYGGTKLGKGGLARAYAGALREALAEVPIVDRAPTVELSLELPYDRVGPLKRLVHPPEVELVDETYGETAQVRLRVFAARVDELRAELADLGIRPDSRSSDN